MPTYTDVFGGANIYPSEISYSSIALSANIALSWPEETSASSNLATRIIDVVASTNGLFINLPDASKTGTGQTVVFNNRGSNTFVVRNSVSTQVVSVSPGTIWQVYLTNNSTVAGTWQSFQFGATTSSANASALAGTGITAVGALLSQSVPVITFNSNYVTTISDRAKMFNWTGAGGTFTLPDPIITNNNWFVYFRNSGSGAVSVDAPGVTTIDGSSALSFQPGESAIISCDGANFFTVGFGQSSTFAFDYTVIDVAGAGNYTLIGVELNKVSYRFNGLLTGNRTVIVPDTVQQYWVDNKTTGSYTLTIKTATGLGVSIAQGQRAILYSDGTDILDADTSGISIPLDVSQGGTGAINAAAALINLGGTSVGTALFTAASQAAAYAALGPIPAGTVNGGTF